MPENSNQNIEQILLEILNGLQEKFFLPVINENRRLASAVQKMSENQEKAYQELYEKIEELQQKVENNPATVLLAIRDAINQSHGGNQNG